MLPCPPSWSRSSLSSSHHSFKWSFLKASFSFIFLSSFLWGCHPLSQFQLSLPWQPVSGIKMSNTNKKDLASCSAGGPSLNPGTGRYPGEEIGYPLQYSWASLMAKMVKNLPAKREIWVRFLGWEEPLEEGMATHSSILAWRIPMEKEPGGLQSMGSQRVGCDRVTKHAQPLS